MQNNRTLRTHNSFGGTRFAVHVALLLIGLDSVAVVYPTTLLCFRHWSLRVSYNRVAARCRETMAATPLSFCLTLSILFLITFSK